MDNIIYYITGDTDVTNDAKNVECDVLFIPVAGTYTMNCIDAANLCNIIRPALAIPTHYGYVVGSYKDAEIFNVPVEVEVSFINNDNAVFKTETLIDTISDAENNLRTRTTDYDIIRIDAVVKVQDEVKELSTFVKR